MRAAGVDTFFDIDRMGAVGLIEILEEMPHYLKVYRRLCREIAGGTFAAAILIDYPTLNLRLARRCRRAGVPVFYFISPQVWAWRRGRVKQIRRTVNKMFVVLPFEKELYLEEGVNAEFLGHPFADSVRASLTRDEARREFGLESGGPVVGLMPGSRKNEVHYLFDVMIGAARRIRKELPACRFVLPVADTLDPDFIRRKLGDNPLDVRLVSGRTYDVLQACDFVIIASGSATLEAGILGVPMVIVYRLNALTYLLARWIVDTPWIGLINIVAGEQVAPELIQGRANEENIAREALAVLQHPERGRALRDRLFQVRDALGQPGVIPRVAQSIGRFMNQRLGDEKISL